MIPLYDNIRSQRLPVVTILLIALNVWIFAGWQMPDIHASAMMAGVIPAALIQLGGGDSVARLGTYMFLHGGWLHLLGNMWFLWLFGRRVEDSAGSVVFLMFYLLCGVLAGLCHVYFASRSMAPLVGASGAISGTLGAYLILYPRARIMTLVPIIIFFRIIALPAALFLLIWIGLQALAQAATPAGQTTGVAYFAHFGGFLSGLLLIPFVRGPARPLYLPIR